MSVYKFSSICISELYMKVGGNTEFSRPGFSKTLVLV